MLYIRKKSHQWLFNELKFYSELPIHYKNRIFFMALNNLCRSPHDKYNWGVRKWLLDYKMNLESQVFVENCKINIQKIYNVSDSPKTLIKKWEHLEETFFRNLCNVENEMKLLKSFYFIYSLHENGICPFILYAFDSWLLEEPIEYIVEISLMYLYKIIPYYHKEIIPFSLVNKEGATSSIFLDKQKNILYKIPKNYAAYKFLLQQEYENVLELKKTKLFRYIANNYAFTPAHILTHNYVRGKTGTYFLKTAKMLDSVQKEELKKFYLEYLNRKDKDIILDIHPDNFVWNEVEMQWFLIDVGSLPTIGREYYEYPSFDQYYQKIWLLRQENIRKYPIRSIDCYIPSG